MGLEATFCLIAPNSNNSNITDLEIASRANNNGNNNSRAPTATTIRMFVSDEPP
jgi:hypothetical protein